MKKYLVPCTSEVLAKADIWGKEVVKFKVKTPLVVNYYGYFYDTGEEYETDEQELYIKDTYTNLPVTDLKLIRAGGDVELPRMDGKTIKVLEVFQVVVQKLYWDDGELLE